MRKYYFALFVGLFAPFAAFAASEGVPSYYKTEKSANATQNAYQKYQAQGYTKYVGQSGNTQVVDSRTYTYQVPRPTVPTITGTMTTNGIAVPPEDHKTTIYAGYARRFADFQFDTGVNSVLEWDDMIFNEVFVGAEHVFSIRNFDMFVSGEFRYGRMESGGLSMDYDLEPFDWADPNYGIFTISMGDQSGDTQHFRFGIGAHHVWDIGGWKLSPVIGYEIFKHNLKMSDHLYPNPGIYLPLLTDAGNYVFGYVADDGLTYYFPVSPYEVDSLGDDVEYYQVCMSPEDIKVIPQSGFAGGAITNLPGAVDYSSQMGNIWGVGPGECIVIGGDGPIRVDGTTHIYDTTWSGFFIGLEVEKQMTLKDKLRFYMQIGLPKYSSEGTWPNRDDWQQNPSFLDEGSNGAYSYAAEMEYNYQISDRLALALKVDTNYFHVGKIGGELYIAGYTDCVRDQDGYCVIDDQGTITIETVPPHTEKISDQLKKAVWQSFGLHLGLKYMF